VRLRAIGWVLLVAAGMLFPLAVLAAYDVTGSSAPEPFQAGFWSIEATVDIDPDSLNPESQGKFVMAYVELPQGYSVADIDVSTVTLEVEGVGGSVGAAPSPTAVGDEDEDGIPDRMVKFSREAVVALLGGVGEYATFVVAGELSSGERFEGSDVVRLLHLPTATPMPVQTATPELIAIIGPSPSPTPVATASPTPVPTASPTPSPTLVPAPGGIYVSVTCQGQPVAGAEVSIIGLYRQETVVWSGGTGDDGELSTGLVLNAGSYVVDILKQGASYDSVIATVPAGAYAPVYAQCTVVYGPRY